MGNKGFLCHQSVSDVLLYLLKHDKDAAAELYTLLEQLELDPSATNIPNINVCVFMEFKGRSFIFYTIYRAKIIPYDKAKKETYYRAFFICDDDLERNIYFFLGLRDYGENVKTTVRLRCWEYQVVLKKQYMAGLTPIWRTE